LHTVTELFEHHHTGKILSLSVRGVLPISCTLNHKFLVIRAYCTASGKRVKLAVTAKAKVAEAHYSQQPVWIDAAEIQVGDYLVMPAMKLPLPEAQGHPWIWQSVRTNAMPLVDRLMPTQDLAWLLGLFAADGSTNSCESESIITMGLSDDCERAARVFTSLGARPRVVRFSNHVRVCVKSRTLTHSFREWFGPVSWQKRLPAFLYSGAWDLKAVLDGLMHGDGHENPQIGFAKYDTTSPLLAVQVTQLVQTLGRFPSLYRPLRHSGYDNAHQIYQVIWFEGNKHRNVRLGEHYGVEVTDVSPLFYEGSVYNLEVEDSHSYLVEGVAAHNCVRDDDGAPTGQGLDEETDFTNTAIAHLEVGLEQKPLWFKMDEINDVGLLRKVYGEVMDFEWSFFRREGETDSDEKSDGRSTDDSVAANAPKQPGNGPTPVVGPEVQAALDA
jgi:hypothetical protein